MADKTKVYVDSEGREWTWQGAVQQWTDDSPISSRQWVGEANFDKLGLSPKPEPRVLFQKSGRTVFYRDGFARNEYGATADFIRLHVIGLASPTATISNRTFEWTITEVEA